ncbi:MAG: SoxR reducing system RseC family protein [Desulfohalobiaceae bacterium]|nr:SoxR reducing system RseC family protein [Desulfohalobiaceae bacterium]
MAIQTEQGMVLEHTGDGQAKIKVSRRAACRMCSLNESCCEPMGHENMVLVARNDPGARVGQEVQVEFEAVSRGKAMGVLYMIPLAALLIGAILGYNLELFGSRDASAALFGLAFLVASFFGISFYNKATWAREARLQPRIVRILSSRAMKTSETERE